MGKFSDILLKKRSGFGRRHRHFSGRHRAMLRFVALLAGILLLAPLYAAASGGAGRFENVITTLSAFGDRSLGSQGSQQAAAFIRETFTQIGIEEVGSQRFSVPVIHYGESSLSIPDRDLTVAIHPLRANAVTPQTIAAPGISGPLVYAGKGTLDDLSGKQVQDAILLMELDSGKNWQQAANLGARALIYIDRHRSPRIFLEDKFELTPIQFPRFWMSEDQARELFGRFEENAGGVVSDEITLVSDARWENSVSENVYAIIPGTDPKLQEQVILVEAFYESTATVGGLSPGADEAVGVATLLELAHYLKQHPPGRTILLVASGGHAQDLAGMRELVWSMSTRSKVLRKMRKDLKALIKDTKKTLNALKNPKFEAGAGGETTDPAAADPTADLLHNALLERIKTDADLISRELMQLRLQPPGQKDNDRIDALALQRQRLRQLVWRTTYTDMPADEARVLKSLIPAAIQDQRAILKDASRKLKEVESARKFRSSAKMYEIAAAVSLHLSSHGDGFGAFNYGFLFPFRPRINRVASYSKLDEVLRTTAGEVARKTGHLDLFKDTLRPSSMRSWQSYFLDRPALGGEVTALAGHHGLTFATTHDARASWGTPFDTPGNVNLEFAFSQSEMICGILERLSAADRLHENVFPRNGISELNGRAKFLRHGELFADKPAPGTILLCYQGPARFYVMVDHLGDFHLRGISDKKHTYHKVIIEGYKFNPRGEVIWTVDKKQTGKKAYRVKMMRRFMETDLVMFACKGMTVFNLLEPRTFRYMTKPNIIDGRREADPLRWFMSRLDTWSSSITSVFLDPGTPVKMTLSDTYLRRKMLLLNATKEKPAGTGYQIGDWPFLHRTEFRVAQDMWTLLTPRIQNLEKRGIFNERIRKLQVNGVNSLKDAEQAWNEKQYGRFIESSKRSWALASRVYYDVDETQKDVLYGVLFYIALFVPFAFCLERLLFAYVNIYKRIIAFSAILLLLIAIIYYVHPAFRLAYSPTVVILAFFIMGLSVMVTLIIFFRFESEVASLQSRAQVVQSGEIGRWKAFVAAFLLGVTNLRRRRLRTVLTCATLVILTFTIMSFTSVKSMRRHARLMYDTNAPYQGFLLKNVNWTDLPAEAYEVIANSFSGKTLVVPRVWLEDEDRTRTTRIPVHSATGSVEARGLVGLAPGEAEVSQLDKILVGGRWLSPGDRFAVLLPERLAENLGINPSRPDGHKVTLWGMPFDVVGVFSTGKLQQLTDLDGEIMTPATFPREAVAVIAGEEEEALESGDDVREFQSRYEHVSADLTLMIPYQTLLAAGGHLKSVAVRIQDETSARSAAEDLVDRFGLSLFSGEADGTFLYHASDSMSYSGVPNIIIPLIIAVFIVLNTMIGSVYERKREIGIYTSVGLAPSHVSFLFIAEAMAFAVLSVVIGYLMAQSAAKLFAETSLWSGITVNYSSLAGVGAMVLVIVVVLVSVLYPSKVAGEIAIPDVNRSWTLPEAKGNQLALTLPFLMTYKEHRSVGGFLYEYFESHQDVSHGMFSTADVSFRFVCETPPEFDATDYDCPEGDCEYDQCMHISSRVWLAPFDFGIMQGVDMRFKPSAEEGGFLELHVDLSRESGEANAWHRINKTFLHHLRKQLLIWRSFDDETKKEYENLLTEAELKLGLRQAPDK